MKTRLSFRVGIIGAIVAAIVAVPISAQATVWWNFYTAPAAGVPVNQHHSVSSGATYNKARTTTLNDLSDTAYISVSGIGTSSAGYQVVMSFAYQRVNASCWWDWYGGYGNGALKCDLGY